MRTRKENEYDDFGIVTDFGNLYNAHKSCRKGKLYKTAVSTYESRSLESTYYLRYLLETGKYRMGKYHCFQVNERGKIRDIKSTQYKDRIVQKSLHENVLIPRIAPTLIYDNSASLKNKGTDFALNRLKIHLRHHIAKHGVNGYILIGDCSGYFDSLQHKMLDDFYKSQFTDERIIDLVKLIHATIPGDKGVPLGNQLSNDDGLIAASPIDHMVKEQLHIKGYGRYNDDFYLIHTDKEYLKYCLKEIGKKAEELGLKLNEKKTKIVPLTTGINFLGFHIYVTETGKIIMRLKAKSKSYERRKLRKHKKKVDSGKMTYEKARESYRGWKASASRGNTYYLLQEMDCYFYSLFLLYLSDEEKERYEKLKRHREYRIRRRKEKCQNS